MSCADGTADEPGLIADLKTRRSLGRSGVRVQRFGLGLAHVGALEGDEGDRLAAETIDTAWDLGVRTFDVAPFYGAGRAERRAGKALASRPRQEFVLSTKVGRLPDGGFDYSSDGIRRQLAASLGRLGLDRVDTVLLHDPDEHESQALRVGIPAVLALRDKGVVGAVGVGMNQSPMLARFVERADIDCVLLASRYTLLDTSAQDDLLPLCQARGVSVLLGGVFNTGVLANPRDGATYDYQPAPPGILARARQLQAIAEAHGDDLGAAAIQFGLAHPAITTILVGASSPRMIAADVEHFRRPLSAQTWLGIQAIVDPSGRLPWPGVGTRR
jgi:D-threo-aldose 1-dehydrogenase